MNEVRCYGGPADSRTIKLSGATTQIHCALMDESHGFGTYDIRRLAAWWYASPDEPGAIQSIPGFFERNLAAMRAEHKVATWGVSGQALALHEWQLGMALVTFARRCCGLTS